MSLIREQRVELGGIRTRMLEFDDGASSEERPAAVLMHGFSDSADTWRPLLGRLGRHGVRGVAFDFPGFGQAARLDREAPILPQLDAFLAAAIEREAERSPSGEVIVAGNSLGGLAALRAAESPNLPVSGIVPIAPAGLDMAGWFGIIEGAPLLQLVLRSPLPVPEFAVREAVGRVYRMLAFAKPGEVDPRVVTSFTRHVRSQRDVVRILGTGRTLRGEIRDPFRLERITCPVLIVWGDQDRMVFSSGSDRVLREVEGARLEVIEHCGHCPQVECPDRLAELISEFAGVALPA